VINLDDADYCFSCSLSTIEPENDEAIIFDKKVITKRKVAWYARQPFTYNYSKITRLALPWTNELLDLKHEVEPTRGEKFNSCLLNL
jgi:alkylated DNA repair dioxygenase AlkB